VSCIQVYSGSVCSSDSSLIDKTALILIVITSILSAVLARAYVSAWVAGCLGGWLGDCPSRTSVLYQNG